RRGAAWYAQLLRRRRHLRQHRQRVRRRRRREPHQSLVKGPRAGIWVGRGLAVLGLAAVIPAVLSANLWALVAALGGFLAATGLALGPLVRVWLAEEPPVRPSDFEHTLDLLRRAHGARAGWGSRGSRRRESCWPSSSRNAGRRSCCRESDPRVARCGSWRCRRRRTAGSRGSCSRPPRRRSGPRRPPCRWSRAARRTFSAARSPTAGARIARVPRIRSSTAISRSARWW